MVRTSHISRLCILTRSCVFHFNFKVAAGVVIHFQTFYGQSAVDCGSHLLIHSHYVLFTQATIAMRVFGFWILLKHSPHTNCVQSVFWALFECLRHAKHASALKIKPNIGAVCSVDFYGCVETAAICIIIMFTYNFFRVSDLITLLKVTAGLQNFLSTCFSWFDNTTFDSSKSMDI